MPKEIIYSTGAAGDGDYHAKVGWTADQGVQVGVEADQGASLFWTLTGCAVAQHPDSASLEESHRRLGGWLRAAFKTSGEDVEGLTDPQLARLVLNTLDASTNDGYSGVWTDLDRAGCNRLVRAVRKARDAAFGRDE